MKLVILFLVNVKVLSYDTLYIENDLKDQPSQLVEEKKEIIVNDIKSMLRKPDERSVNEFYQLPEMRSLRKLQKNSIQEIKEKEQNQAIDLTQFIKPEKETIENFKQKNRELWGVFKKAFNKIKSGIVNFFDPDAKVRRERRRYKKLYRKYKQYIVNYKRHHGKYHQNIVPQFYKQGIRENNLAKITYGEANEHYRKSQRQKIQYAFFLGEKFCSFKYLNLKCYRDLWEKLQRWMASQQGSENKESKELKKKMMFMRSQVNKEFLENFKAYQKEEKIFRFKFVNNVLKAYHKFIIKLKKKSKKKFILARKMAKFLTMRSLAMNIAMKVNLVNLKFKNKLEKQQEKDNATNLGIQNEIKEHIDYLYERNEKLKQMFYSS